MSKSSKRNSENTPEPSSQSRPKGYTPPKGRPTPKRVEQEIKRGVRRDPSGMTTAELAANRKKLKASMSKQEWKEFKKKEREDRQKHNKEVQERMAAGDERYLLARDRGEVRRFVRNWVDSRRFINEWVMPAAIVLMVLLFVSTASPVFANVLTIISMVVIIVFAVEAVWLARKCNNAVRLKFPGTTEAGYSLGFYAFSRASQPRKWRTPRPQVERGADIH